MKRLGMNDSRFIPGRRSGGPMEPSGSLWPNGEFSIGYAPCGGMERELTPSEYAEKWDKPIGLAIAANSHSEDESVRSKRGKNGLTAYGRRLLRNSVEMLERCYGQTNLSFVTLTLPDLTKEEHANVCENWSDIIRVYYQRLGRACSRAGLPNFYAGCVELQPKRSAREGVPVLHVHHIIVGRRRNQKDWVMRPVVFRNAWRDAVSRFLWNDYSWEASERVEGVRWSAAAYLSKYFTKEQTDEEGNEVDYSDFVLPSAWYNIALNLKRAVLKRVRKDSRLMEIIEREARAGFLKDGCKYFYAGSIEEMPGNGPHYFVGKMKPEFMKEIIEIWRAEVLMGG